MRGVATDIGIIHFIGIGGIGMSGIAEVMHNLGYQVQGSDIADSYVVEGLRKRGIKVAIGHEAANVDGVAVVVTSTAVQRGNPEVEAALAHRIPIVRRAETKGLAEIAAETRDLAERARARRLKPEEFQGGTFSVSNLGMFGVRSFSSIVNEPQGAILSVGAGEPRPGGVGELFRVTGEVAVAGASEPMT